MNNSSLNIVIVYGSEVAGELEKFLI